MGHVIMILSTVALAFATLSIWVGEPAKAAYAVGLSNYCLIWWLWGER